MPPFWDSKGYPFVWFLVNGAVVDAFASTNLIGELGDVIALSTITL
ncbi:hypothetical protein LY16_03680 [Xenorhabdus doucetiae]|nr:hypothetical protein LY16_03680 [Xenorhabdus doucetiae]